MDNKPWLDAFIEEKGWINNSVEKNMNYLIEEIGEFAREVRRHESGREEHPEEAMNEAQMRSKLIEEAGDVLAAFYTILKQYDIKGFSEPVEHFKLKMENQKMSALIWELNSIDTNFVFKVDKDGKVQYPDPSHPKYEEIMKRVERWIED